MAVPPLLMEPLTSTPDVTIAVPGSKSHTNRALLCTALAAGESRLEGALFAEDTRAMMGALSSLGIQLRVDEVAETVTVTGCDGRLPSGPLAVDVVQSGTTSRFLLAMLGLGPGPYRLDGDVQLRARPFGPLVGVLAALGVEIEGDHLPLTVTRGGLRAGKVELSGSVSSQFLSGLLMAAPYARTDGEGPGEVVIELSDPLVSKPYVALTMATMASLGVVVDSEDYRRFVVAPQRYRGGSVAIEPDASAASYFFAAAAITGGRVRVPGLGRGTVQGDVHFVEILRRMGARVEVSDQWIEVEGGGELHGVEANMADLSDVAQTLAVVATFATTPTTVTGIGFIQYKETDRLAAVVTELTKLGIRAERDADGFTIHPGRPRPGVVATYDDHRMAMSFALLGLRHPGITIEGPDCVAKTFPGFFSTLGQLRP